MSTEHLRTRLLFEGIEIQQIKGDPKMFDHYIALDWAQRNMAIARMTKESSQVKVVDVPGCMTVVVDSCDVGKVAA